jgi:sugar lactone lactonase YvrE
VCHGFVRRIFLWLAVAALLPGFAARAQVYSFTTIAGHVSAGSSDGTAKAARFFAPLGVAIDNRGVIYVADSGDHTIRRISPGGDVTTLAGVAGIRGSVDGTGPSARFNSPAGVAVDTDGNLVVADTQNHVIRKITASGVVTTVAGMAGVGGSADGTASTAQFLGPQGVAVDSVGNVFVADSGNHTIRKIPPNGVTTTVAGLAGASGNTDGTGTTARFGNPFGVAVDGGGNLFVSDSYFHGSSRSPLYDQAIRKITATGVVTTLVTTTNSFSSSNLDGAAGTARIGEPRGIAVDGGGNVFFADYGNDTIRLLSPDGMITTVAGMGSFQGQGDFADSTGANARFSNPSGLAVNWSGSLFVADTGNNAIRQITASRVVTTLAGSANNIGAGADGFGSEARFHQPEGVTVDRQGNVYVADTSNFTVRRISAEGVVTTLAGAWGVSSSVDGAGDAARFAYPGGLAVGSDGNIFVADSVNCTVRRITAEGVVTTVAGKTRVPGTIDGVGSAAEFTFPEGIALDRSGNLFVTDSRSNVIRKVTPAGVVTTFAGAADLEGSADGTGGGASFFGPKGIALDSQGNFFVADSYNHTIRKITVGGVVTTVAGMAGAQGNVDGPGSVARFHNPIGVALDGAGNILVADAGNNTVRKITAGGLVTTVAGSPTGQGGMVDGAGSLARFSLPWGIAVDASGSILVCDYGNSAIRRITSDGMVTTLAGGLGNLDGAANLARFNSPYGVAMDDSGNVFVADTYDQTIRKITTDGVVTTLAGQAGRDGNADGKGSDARFSWPTGIAVNGDGNVFVADLINSTIRKITPDGIVSTLAGAEPGVDGGPRGYVDGVGRAARFDSPFALAIDPSGSLLVAEQNNQVIRKVTPAGVVTTLSDAAGNPLRLSSSLQALAVDLGGNVFAVSFNRIFKILPGGTVTIIAGAESQGFRDGPGNSAWFNFLSGIAVDLRGNVFVADQGNMAIRMITPDGMVTTIGGSALEAQGPSPLGGADGLGSAARFNRPVGIAVDRNGNVIVADTNNNLIRKGVPLANPARLGNVSVLASLAGGADTVTVGTIIGGSGTSGPKPLLVRAAGPSLAPFGVAGFLADPELEFYTGTTRTAASDDWQGLATLNAIFVQVGAFPFATPSSRDAALYLPLVNAASNTVRVSGTGTAGGVVLTELYDATSVTALTPETPRLTNVSVLKDVGSGLTAGFIIKGEGVRTVLIRAVGPSLAPFGVPSVLGNPRVEVFDGQQRSIARNDNWGDAGTIAAAELNAAFLQVGAFALAGSGSKDSALLATLTAGNYTVQVRSADSTTGVVLLEVYEVP